MKGDYCPDEPAEVKPAKQYSIIAESTPILRQNSSSRQEPDYKYNEGRILDEVRAYINGTYGEHYATDKYQATDMIIDAGWGEGFCMGNILKYAKRYGKKNGYDRKDLLKIIHYAVIQLSTHDREHNSK